MLRGIDRWVLILIALISFLLNPVRGAEVLPEPMMLRFGFSSTLFPSIKKADAEASIKVWGDRALGARLTDAVTVPLYFERSEDLLAAFSREEIDLVALRGLELFLVADDLKLNALILNSVNGSVTEEYRILVRRDSGIKALADLKGKRIGMQQGIDLDMGTLWLDTVVLQEQGMPAVDFFGEMVLQSKESRGVLGVFFGTEEACMVSLSVFETMVELNPQLGEALCDIIVSPKFIPQVVCFRKSYPLPRLEVYLDTVAHVHENPFGKQMLTVFGIDQLVIGNIDDLETVKEWMELHESLLQQVKEVAPAGQGGQP